MSSYRRTETMRVVNHFLEYDEVQVLVDGGLGYPNRLLTISPLEVFVSGPRGASVVVFGKMGIEIPEEWTTQETSIKITQASENHCRFDIGKAGKVDVKKSGDTLNIVVHGPVGVTHEITLSPERCVEKIVKQRVTEKKNPVGVLSASLGTLLMAGVAGLYFLTKKGSVAKS